jgi:thermitase
MIIMLKKSLYLSVLSSAFLFSTVNASEFPHNGYIVKLKDGSKAFQEKSFSNVGSTRELNVSFGNFVKLDTDLDLSNKSFDALKSHPDVLYIEPNYIYSIENTLAEDHGDFTDKTVQDSEYSRQWGLKNTGKNSGGWFSSGKAGEDINAEKAWEITKGDKEVIVGVIDTGVDFNHPDLKSQMWTNDAELNGVAGVDDDANGYVDDIYGYNFVTNTGSPMDGHAHGTHCAGVIGAEHNSQGIAGIMANVRIMALKFLSDSGSGETEGAIRAIDYGVTMGAKVLNNSWGGGGRSEALLEAIQRANEAGVIFVAAAGNDSSDNDKRPTYPANYEVENVITVGSMEGKGARSSFSNYGKTTVHVFAPGSNIYSTVRRNGYSNMSGTSMASPHVAGIMGLLVSQEPGISPVEARERIISSAVQNSTLTKFTVSGRADAHRLLTNQR